MGRRKTTFTVTFCIVAAVIASASGFDLDAFDSAELSLVAITRGLGHPPGQPLHTLLGWLVTRLPVRPLFLLHLLSIVPFALACAFAVVRAIDEVTALGVSVDLPPALSARGMIAPALGAIGCAAFAALPLPVRDAVGRVEVYALAASLAFGSVLAAGAPSRTRATLAGVLLGLAACANPVLAAQGVGAGFLVLSSERPARARLFDALAMGAGTMLGSVVYAYAFAVRSRGAETLVWAAPTDVASFRALLLAADFRTNVSLSPTTLLPALGALLLDWSRHGIVPVVAFGIAGAFVIAQRAPRRQRVVFLRLALPPVLALAIGATMVAANVPYRGANPDYGGYALVPLLLSLPGACALAALAFARARPLASRLLAVCVMISLSLAALPPSIERARSSGAVRRLAEWVLRSAPERSLMLLSSDHLLFPILYLQGVEGVRRDVTIVNAGWASSSWAWEWIRAREPHLTIDLTPGLGGERRLSRALLSREAGRAVVAESLDLLRLGARGAVCPRGLLWSSEEGCHPGELAHRARSSAVALGVTPDAARAFAGRASWDRRVQLYVARSFADDAVRIGCRGLARTILSISLARDSRLPEGTRMCGASPASPAAPPPDLLTIGSDDAERALASLSP